MEQALGARSASDAAVRGSVRHVFSQWPSDVAPGAPWCARWRARSNAGAAGRYRRAFRVDGRRPAERRRHSGDLLRTRATSRSRIPRRSGSRDEIVRATAVLERLALEWCGAD
jgi:hypothetical protein